MAYRLHLHDVGIDVRGTGRTYITASGQRLLRTRTPALRKRITQSLIIIGARANLDLALAAQEVQDFFEDRAG